jgi:heme/copper-type cytochrome/quinol oxidase subunit 2
MNVMMVMVIVMAMVMVMVMVIVMIMVVIRCYPFSPQHHTIRLPAHRVQHLAPSLTP